jgi:diacylglycerol kinase family enzyme
MSTIIIFNPYSGRGQAWRRLLQLPLQSFGACEFWPTTASGHAEELAFSAAMSGVDTIVAAGGDGTVHEVANGLLRSGRDSMLAILPIGSANDYFHSVQQEAKNRSNVKPLYVDVGRVREPGGKQRYFVCCLGLGLNGAVTLEARKIRGLQGIPLYGLATLRALIRHYDCPELSVALDEGPSFRRPTLMVSVMLGRREGGFVMAPKARLCDGLFDYVWSGALSRWQVLRLLPRLALFGAPEQYPHVEIGRCHSLHLASPTNLIVHIDGEFFCRPEDEVRQIDIDLLPGHLCVRPVDNTDLT